MSEIQDVDVHTLKEQLNEQTRQLIDVRTYEEYEAGHLSCVHIPLDELPHRLNELNKSQPFALICAGGVRSRQACELMQAQGFDVMNVAGGIKAWCQQINSELDK